MQCLLRDEKGRKGEKMNECVNETGMIQRISVLMGKRGRKGDSQGGWIADETFLETGLKNPHISQFHSFVSH